MGQPAEPSRTGGASRNRSKVGKPCGWLHGGGGGRRTGGMEQSQSSLFVTTVPPVFLLWAPSRARDSLAGAKVGTLSPMTVLD